MAGWPQAVYCMEDDSLKKPSRSEAERVGKINKSVKKCGLETQKGDSIS